MEERQKLSQMSIAELIEFVLGLEARVDHLARENVLLKEENRRLKQELAIAKKSRPNQR